MKRTAALIFTVCTVLGGAWAVSAQTNDVRSLPSPALTAFVSGKTFDSKINGYGWGEEDDVSSLSLEFIIMEPVTFAAEDIEGLAKGDTVTIGYDFYTVADVRKEGESVIMTPEDEWLTPVTFTPQEDGVYTAENEEGVLKTDSFSFPSHLASELVYVNAGGEELTAAELLHDLADGSLDTDGSRPEITFDENGYIIKADFSE